MFYAHNIFSMESKTEESLLYYISTTNNLNRKVNKKAILQIDIKRTLVDIVSKPYALRLYSFILKGVVKLYLLKIKYFESELTGLMNILKYKPEKKKLSKSEDISDASLEEYAIGYKNETVSINTNLEMDEMDILYLDDCTNQYIDVFNKRKIDKVDEIIEKDNFMQTETNIKKPKIFNFDITIDKYSIFSLIQASINKNEESINEEFNSLEIIRNESGTSIPSRLSSSSLGANKELEFVQEDETNFCLLNYGTRYEQAINFYNLLDKLSKGLIVVYQEYPYSKITILS